MSRSFLGEMERKELSKQRERNMRRPVMGNNRTENRAVVDWFCGLVRRAEARPCRPQ